MARQEAGGRLVGVVAAVGVVIAGIGLVTGTSGGRYEPVVPPVVARPDPGPVPPARSHAELESNPWRKRGVPPGLVAASADGDGELAPRESRRAFDGAPPTIPHPVSTGSAGECLACHGQGVVLGGRRASALPHAELASCTQCHAPEQAGFTRLAANAAAEVGNDWRGFASEGGSIAYDGAPPSVPHADWMRENCDACHGPGGRAPLRTSHPGRQSCLQCHPLAAATAGPPGP
ncbi:MAG: hypothetical protein QNK05_01280 [Myxococcota bacterium]|nr:hypothetical protein [Myxococcota bacterium]